jgi:hypothetical protein
MLPLQAPTFDAERSVACEGRLVFARFALSFSAAAAIKYAMIAAVLNLAVVARCADGKCHQLNPAKTSLLFAATMLPG